MHTPPQQRLLHNVEHARQMLSLGRTKFYEEVHAGRLTLVKAGKRSLVPQASLDAYVAERIKEATAATK
jgi:excisionase family DNA binding protein